MAEVTPQELVQLAMSLVNTDLKLQCQNWAIQLEKQKESINKLEARVAFLEQPKTLMPVDECNCGCNG